MTGTHTPRRAACPTGRTSLLPAVIASGSLLLAAVLPAGASNPLPTFGSSAPSDTLIVDPGAGELKIPGPAGGQIPVAEAGFDAGQLDLVGPAPESSFTESLRAGAPGLSVERASGMIGMGSRLRLRGVNSLRLSNAPLVYVDGIRISNVPFFDEITTGGPATSPLEDLDPEEIARIWLLRGPAAAGLYGGDAAAGVLVVETKRGSRDGDGTRTTLRAGQGVVEDTHDYPDNLTNLSIYFGVQDPGDSRLDEFRTLQNPVTGHVFAVDNPLMDPNRRPFRQGHQQSYSATVRGSHAGLAHFASLRYRHFEGTLSPNHLQRLNSRVNLDFSPIDRLDLGLNLGFVRSQHRFPNEHDAGHAMEALMGSPVHSFGTDPVQGPGHGPCLLEALTGEGVERCEARHGLFETGFDRLELKDQGENRTRWTGSMSARLRPTPWLDVQATVGRDGTDREVFERFPPELVPVDGLAADAREDERVTTFDLGTSASMRVSDRIRSTTSLGVQRVNRRSEGTSCVGRGFPEGAALTCDNAILTSGRAWFAETRESGMVIRQGLAFDDALFGSIGVRRTDHRILGKTLWSPSLHASWMASETVMLPLPAFVDLLRVRLAGGTASRGAPLAWNVTANGPSTRPLERTREWEGGLDAEVLSGRLALAFTYFDVRTSNAFVRPQGGSATLTNRGTEVLVDIRAVDRPSFTWDLRLSASSSDPIVRALDTGSVPAPGNLASASQWFHPGLPPGAYAGPVIGSATRDEDGRITSAELLPGTLVDGFPHRYLGSPHPRREQALSATFHLIGRLSIQTLFDRASGHRVLNANALYRAPLVSLGTSEDAAFRELRTTPEMQAMIEGWMLAAFLEDGTFIKWRKLAATWELRPATAARFGASEARITVGGRELGTLTRYGGIDPELNARGSYDGVARFDRWGIAIPRTFFAGIDVIF